MEKAENVDTSSAVRSDGKKRKHIGITRWILFVVAIIIVMLIYSSIHYYIFRRLVWAFNVESVRALWGLRAAIILMAFIFPTARLIENFGINPLSTVIDWVGSIWLGLGFYLLTIGALTHLIATIIHFAAPSVNARIVLSPAMLIAALLVSAYALHEGRETPRVTQFDARMKNLPQELEGFKVVQITDLHIGGLVNRKMTARMVDGVNALQPDLVVITGDLVDESPRLLGSIFPEFARLKSRYGVLACTGNHEFYHGVKQVVKETAAVNIRYLRNEKVVVAGSLLVYGIDDPAIERMGGKIVPFEEVIGPEAKMSPAILLYHRPARLEQAANLGIDLMLDGHTHNGQLWPFRYVVKLAFPKVSGHFYEGGCHMYASRGIGTWGPPMRLRSHPEIVKITLHPSK